MNPKQLDDTLCVLPQIALDDVALAAQCGFRSIINNRPDGEEPGQPTSAEIEAAARAAGLEYLHLPIVPGQVSDDQIDRFDKALETMPKPILGFCRTGTRSTTLWALARCCDLGAGTVCECAADAGYDLSAMRARLEQRQG